MGLIICFILGVTNFACHKAVMKSGHPFVEDTKTYFGKHFGKYGGYSIEFLILLAALIYSNSLILTFIYIAYSGLNMVTAYMLINGKI